MSKSFCTTHTVDAFGHPIRYHQDFIDPMVEQRFKEITTMMLYEAFRNQGTNPRDLGVYLQDIIREAQKEVSSKLHWAEQNISWSRKEASDLSWPKARTEIVEYAKS